MKKKLLAPLWVIFFPVLLSAQSLDFETLNPKNNMPEGWSKYSPLRRVFPEPVYADSLIKHSGNYSLFISGENDSQTYAMLTSGLPYAGDTVCLRGHIKASDLTGVPYVTFSLLGSRETDEYIVIKKFAISNHVGDDWVSFELKSALCPEIRNFSILCCVNGTGKIWLDDLDLTIDDKPLSEAKRKPINKIKYKASQDKEFNKGSGFILPKQLSTDQVENLNVLARVWGLLKYYHPAVARGDYNWDYELFRIMPKVYDATVDRRNEILREWIESLGVFEKDCNRPNEGVSWVGDTKRFGEELSKKLVEVSISKRWPFHYYFRPDDGAVVPVFCNEATYPNMNYSDSGMRLLGVFRLWSAIEFFYPYRYMTDDRDKMLSDALFAMSFPEVNDKAEYLIVICKLLYGIHDSHGYIIDSERTSVNKLFPYGVPFITDALVEGKFVVAHSFGKPGEGNLLKHDAITHIDGQSVESFIERYKYLDSNSNDNKLAQSVASSRPYLCNKERVTYTVDREGTIVEVQTKAYPLVEWMNMVMEYRKNVLPPKTTHKIYEDSVAYISIGISIEEMKAISKEYLSYPKIVIDNRGGRQDEEVSYMLMELLPECLPVARSRCVDFNRPGNFTEVGGSCDFFGRSNNRRTKVVVIVDHTTESYGESVTMMLQNVPGMNTLGSQTSGSNGETTSIFLPGEIKAIFTGFDLFYADGGQVQGVGVRVDEVVTPTLKGVREGRDELLERALEMVKQNK